MAGRGAVNNPNLSKVNCKKCKFVVTNAAVGSMGEVGVGGVFNRFESWGA